MQLIADQFGGDVQPSSTREYGAATLEINDPSKLFHDIPKQINIWMSHSDSVGKIPSGFKGLGCTSSCKIAAFEHTAENQFMAYSFILKYHIRITEKTLFKTS